MSDLTATVEQTKNGFHVEGIERISYDFTFLDGVFDPENPQLAECYKRWGRALAVTDQNVYDVYGEQIERYFKNYNITLKVHRTKIGEKAKTIPTWASIADSMTEFGIYRKVLAFLLRFNVTNRARKGSLTFYRSQYLLSEEVSSRMLLGKETLCQRLYQGTLPSIS